MISRIDTERGAIEYADVGSGDPVLYFHGMLSGSDLALLIEKQLVEDGFRIIIPHRPGYLGTPIQGRTTAVDCAEIAVNVLDELGIERAGVVGTSAGGPPAIAFAARYPQRTAALVLQCAQVHRWDSVDWLPRPHQWTFPLFKMTWSRWLACCAYFWMCRLMSGGPKKCLQGWSSARFSEIQHDAHANHVAGEFLTSFTGFPGYCNDSTIFVCEDTLSQAQILCPTLILHDPLDETVPIAHAEYAAKQIKNAQLLKLNLGGHFIWAGRDIEILQSARYQFLKENLA